MIACCFRPELLWVGLAWCLVCLTPAVSRTIAVPAGSVPLSSAFFAGRAFSEGLLSELFVADPQDNGELLRLVADVALSPPSCPCIREAVKLFLFPSMPELGLLASLLRIRTLLLEELRRPDTSATSVPGLRRILVGAIVWQRLQGGQAAWSAPAQALVADICSALVALHTAAARRKTAIEFLHVSKSGGSSMCLAAQQNGCSTQSFGQRGTWGNCKIDTFNDLPRWVSPAGHQESGPLPVGDTPWWLRHGEGRSPGQDDCVMRSAAMKAGNYSYYSNEYAAHTSHPSGGGGERAGVCADFMNVALLRNPVKRLSSHVRSIILLYQSYPNGTRWLEGRDAAYWRRLAPAAVDNFYTRTLLGQPVFQLPSGALRPAHAAAARRQLLEQYDVLLVLEQVTASKLMLQLGLGWVAGRLPHRNHHAAPTRDMLKLMPADFADLVDSNALDMEVYRWARMLQRLDTFAFAVAAAAGSPAAGAGGVVEGGDGGARGGAGARRRASESGQLLSDTVDAGIIRQANQCGFVGRGSPSGQ